MKETGELAVTGNLQIELLFFEGCASHDETCRLLGETLAELDMKAEVSTTIVRDAEAAQRHRLLGSPTVRVNGRDIEPVSDQRDDYGLG